MTAYDAKEPMGLGYSYADLVSGLYGALAVLTAVEYRERTGRGQYIDLSEYEAMCTTIGPTFLDILANKREIIPDGSPCGTDAAAPHGCYPCAGDDRWGVIAVFSDEEWRALCRVMGGPSWADDDKFSSFAKRKEHKKELDRLITQWTAAHPAKNIVHLLQDVGINAGVVQNAEDVASDPHLLAGDFFVHFKNSVTGDTIFDRSPIRMNGVRLENLEKAPLLGEDNNYVFKELLGFTEKQIAAYIDKGVIA
jgi:crotonobetainyl-CoA:carnitine CoA-transferase CaiB-like acyl-CoA transferase